MALFNMYHLTSSPFFFFCFFFSIQGLGFTTPATPLPSVIPTDILRPTRGRCHSNSCSGSYKMKSVCEDGYCVCTGQDYDYHTCLRKFFFAANQVQRLCSDANIRCFKEKYRRKQTLLQNGGRKFKQVKIKNS